MRQAKLIISRAGATTTYEIFTINKPCIIIPSEKTKNNHQVKNAEYFHLNKLCKYIREKEAEQNVGKVVDKLIYNNMEVLEMMKAQRNFVKKQSVEKILEEINYGYN